MIEKEKTKNRGKRWFIETSDPQIGLPPVYFQISTKFKKINTTKK
jgi:hypothetical protein